MAKTSRPLTRSAPPRPTVPDGQGQLAFSAPRLAHTSSGANQPEVVFPSKVTNSEPEYLVAGTGCVSGHQAGSELVDGLGDLPSAKLSKIGIGLIAWAMFGMAVLGQLPLLNLALIAAVLWMLFSLVVQHRSGHRGRCRLTRAWRHAWGGLVPVGKDPTRPAGS